MLILSISRDNLLDDFFGFPFGRYGTSSLTNTNIKDTDNGYEITINIPEVKKEGIKAELRDGCLTIRASTDSNKKEKNSSGRYVRREHYNGFCSRSFYVRDAVTQGNIRAKSGDSTLKLLTPRKGTVSEVEERKYIAIEG